MTDLKTRAVRMARAGIGSGLTTVWSALLGLITAPFLIGKLGTSQYGVFALVSIVSSYLTNLEFGFGHATVRFLARARATGSEDEETAVLGNSIAVFLAGSIGACCLAFFGASFIVANFAHGPRALHHTFLEAVRLGALVIGVQMFSSVVSSSLQALGSFAWLINTNWIFGTVLSAGAVTIVVLGGGLVDIITLQLVVASISLALSSVVLRRATSASFLPRISRGTFGEMARFSVFIMLGGFASQTMIQAPPAILAAYKTSADVAAFAIPSTIFLQLGTIVGSAGMAFLPFVSAASVEADHAPIRALYAANLRLTILVLAPILAFLGVFAHPLLATWISAGFASKAAMPLRLLMGAALMLALSGAPNDLARAFGKASLVTLYAVLASCASVAASLLAVPAHGAAGAAFGLLTGLTVITVPFLFLDGHWTIEMSPLSLARSLSGPCSGALFVLALYVGGLLISDSFLSAIITGAVATPIYVAVAAKALLDRREREVLSSMLRRVRRSAPEPDDGTAINVPLGTATLAGAELTSSADPDPPS